MKVGEFFYELGIDAKPGKESVDSFIKSILELKTATMLTGLGLGTLEEFFRSSITSSSQAAVNFQKFTNQTNLSWQELQRWQIVARQANVSAETIASGVFNLQMNLAALARGEGPIGAFQKLGIGPEGNPFQIIERLRAESKRIAPAQMTDLVQQIGLSPEWMNVIRLPDEQFAEFKKAAFGMSAEGEKSILEMTKSWNELWLAMNDVRIAIAEILSGPLGKLLHLTAELLRNPTGGGTTGVAMAGVPGMMGDIYDWATKPTPEKNWAKGGDNLTNTVHMTVNGDTHDKNFADDVVKKIFDETEANLPLNESTALVGSTGH